MKRKVYHLLVHLFFKDVAKEDFLNRIIELRKGAYHPCCETNGALNESKFYEMIGRRVESTIDPILNQTFHFLKF